MHRALRAAALAASALSLGLAPAAASADGPGVGAAGVVTVGDSFISGEAGRWAGNSNASASRADALGSSAYFDAGSGETIPRCHRSSAAEAFIGVPAANFACSGAVTSSAFDGSNWKPGLDFADQGSGRVGQATLLRNYAQTHNVRMVSVSIGGNDFGFAGVVQSCVQDFLTSSYYWKDYCRDDTSVKANFTSANVAAKTTAIKNALLNVRSAMSQAGYADADYKIVAQTYMSPIPGGSGFRYKESGYSRQSTGGCGFWSSDADWANNTALATINGAVKNAAAQTGLSNIRTLDLANAFNGRRLCENTVGLIEEKGSPAGSRRAPPTRPNGSTRSVPSRRSAVRRTTSRSRSTRTTGVSSRSATAPAPPSTVATRVVAPAPAGTRPAATPRVSRT